MFMCIWECSTWRESRNIPYLFWRKCCFSRNYQPMLKTFLFFIFGSYYLHTSPFKEYILCKFLQWYTGSTFDWVKYSFFPCFTSLSWQQPNFSLYILFHFYLGGSEWRGKKASSSFWSTMTNMHPLCYKSSVHFSVT